MKKHAKTQVTIIFIVLLREESTTQAEPETKLNFILVQQGELYSQNIAPK